MRQNFGNWSGFLSDIGRVPVKFIPTKNGITRKGTRNKDRKEITNHNGYVQVYEPEHPTAMKNGYCLLHRKMAWDLGILTDLSDVVHHRDEIRVNNVESNFKIMTTGQHTSLHCKGSLRPRKAANPCIFLNCGTLVASRYNLCQKHYKAQWDKLKRGSINNFHEGANQ